jgi:hypothetical protein
MIAGTHNAPKLTPTNEAVRTPYARISASTLSRMTHATASR